MPRYNLKKRSDEFHPFQNSKHLVHFLTKTRKHHELYKTHFKEKAQSWLDERETPPTRINKHALKRIINAHPRTLAQEVMTEVKQQRKGEEIGGGLISALQTLGRQAANTLGIPKILEWFGHGYKHKRLPREAQIFAAAIEETYESVDKRRDKLYGLTRVPEYDSSRLSVWREQNGDYFISVRGTKFTAHDIGNDLGILAGAKMKNAELERVVSELVAEGHHIDIGGHSLATQYITNLPQELQEHIDEVYLFNPASSDFMDDDYLSEIANNDKYTYFINPSDIVSGGIWNKMDHDTVDNNYIGHYRWSPLAAHSMSQWVTDLEDDEIDIDSPENVSKREEYKAQLHSRLRSDAKAIERARKEDEAREEEAREEEVKEGILSI